MKGIIVSQITPIVANNLLLKTLTFRNNVLEILSASCTTIFQSFTDVFARLCKDRPLFALRGHVRILEESSSQPLLEKVELEFREDTLIGH